MSRLGITKSATSPQLDVLVDQLESRGNLPLIQVWTATEPRQWSYRYIGQQIHSLARGLRRQIAIGETVVLLGIDRPEWIIAALAILRAGAVVTPIDVQIANDTLKHVLDATKLQIGEAIGEIGRSLPSYQRLHDFALTRELLPRTRLEKIMRHKLEQRYACARRPSSETTRNAPQDPREMTAEDRELIEQPAASSAWTLLSRRYPK
jgi:acyl-coenzyme A synthetase/AMP-(fatty) acid ligase